MITNMAIVDRLCLLCANAPPTLWPITEAQFSHNSIYFLNLSPINAKLTSLSYIHASQLLVYL